MKMKEIRELSPEELKTTLADNYEALNNLKFRNALKQEANPAAIRNTRKTIARLLTIQKEREMKAQNN
ncbi:MAG: 50S ribosomal protein L29 [Ignavibacteriaceae bacterium]|nr:MAG: 50S ribosomal protein L29 [Ignavibacteriaceae bacterium]